MRAIAAASSLWCALAQFQFEIPAEMFGQMGGGMGGIPAEMFGQMGGGEPAGQGFPDEITHEYNWLKGTEWHWNDWRNVKFHKDGRFEAPDKQCKRGRCRWSASEEDIYVQWGRAGLHTLKASKMKAEKGTRMDGTREDGDECHATYVSTFDKVEDEVNLYEALGVTEEATDREIKKAYRKLSIKYHPDKNQGNEEALKKFNAVRDAYEVLSNEEKKILYDTGGMEAVKEHEKEEAGGGGGADPFSMLFGGGGGGRGRNSKKGQDAQVELGVSLEDMYSGGEVTAQISRRVVCKGCKGKKKTGKCKECNKCPPEVRMVQRQMGPGMVVQQQEQVPSKHRCKEAEAKLDAQIEQGMDSGSEIKFPRMSEQTPGQIPGDIILIVKQKPHKKFKRKGNDLHMDMEITLKEALLGFSKKIEHLDKHEVGRLLLARAFHSFVSTVLLAACTAQNTLNRSPLQRRPPRCPTRL